jgi:hypothetical protein
MKGSYGNFSKVTCARHDVWTTDTINVCSTVGVGRVYQKHFQRCFHSSVAIVVPYCNPSGVIYPSFRWTNALIYVLMDLYAF